MDILLKKNRLNKKKLWRQPETLGLLPAANFQFTGRIIWLERIYRQV